MILLRFDCCTLLLRLTRQQDEIMMLHTEKYGRQWLQLDSEVHERGARMRCVGDRVAQRARSERVLVPAHPVLALSLPHGATNARPSLRAGLYHREGL
jgi:hypothetical protein